jgi:hypothetical protein
MAEYIFLTIGTECDLAFPFKDAAKVHHSFEEVFPQLKEEAVSLFKIFGAAEQEDSPRVILTMNDNSSFLALDSYISEKSEEVSIFPIPPCLFREDKAWAKAVLNYGERTAFAVNPGILKGLQNG